MIVYGFTKDDGFAAGDTETRVTCYAYPSSVNARMARRNPGKVAESMLTDEALIAAYMPKDIRDEYDARVWEALGNTY